jgi:hypothetical protein
VQRPNHGVKDWLVNGIATWHGTGLHAITG